MSTFYVKNEQIHGEKIYIVDEDVNHIKNVLRGYPKSIWHPRFICSPIRD